jgi:hypothetical protein
MEIKKKKKRIFIVTMAFLQPVCLNMNSEQTLLSDTFRNFSFLQHLRTSTLLNKSLLSLSPDCDV